MNDTPRTYLDHAATSPLRPEARAAMERGFAIWANPSSPHAEGRRARAALEDARDRCKAALGWEGELIFTSGASEALAIGLGRAKVDRRIVSAVEHDAVFRAAPDAEVLPLREGTQSVDLAFLQAALAQEGSAIVAVQSVNPETGLCMFHDNGSADPSEVTALVHEHGGLTLSDCAQSAGKLALPDADLVVVSAHKFGGPIGIGALLVRDYAMLEPTGGHERGYRSGTENLPGALGMAAALECPKTDFREIIRESGRFLSALQGSRALPESGNDCGHIFAMAHPALSAQAALIRLDAMGFAVSAGSACSSGTLKPSRVLKAFGIPDDLAKRTIRVSLGWNTTKADLEAFADAWEAFHA